MKPHLLGVTLALALVVTVGAGAPAATADADCPQTKAVFYTTDTQNLARALGANKSDCADYYISITPTGPRGPAARRRGACCCACAGTSGSTRSPSCSPRSTVDFVRGCQRLVCGRGEAPRRDARGRLRPGGRRHLGGERGRQPLRLDREHGRLQRRGRCAGELPRLHSGSLHRLGWPDDAGARLRGRLGAASD